MRHRSPGTLTSGVETKTIHVDGSARGHSPSAPADREALTVRTDARRYASITTLRRPDESARGLPWLARRPIAPGNVWCPLPPWDAAFPGAFFRASRRVPVAFFSGPTPRRRGPALGRVAVRASDEPNGDGPNYLSASSK